jgi:serine/threonine protein kinase
VHRAYSESTKDVGSVSGSDAAKVVELFEREGRILAHLDHPRIPKHIDRFTVETGDDTQLHLVQEYVDAQSLAQLVEAGRHFTEQEVVQIALQVADILAYLHDRSPPLVHRDIKPSNILYGDGGDVSLIDFGAVKDRLVQYGLEGSTIVGTYGYMPLEQYQGDAVPASDIYSLGATLIVVLAHLEPSEIGRRGSRLDFRPHVNVSPRFADVLAKMVEPDVARRYRTASALKQALEALRSPSTAVGFADTLAKVVEPDVARRYPTASAVKQALEALLKEALNALRSPSTAVAPSERRKWFPVQIGFIPPWMLVDSEYSIYGIRLGFVLGENRDVYGLDVAFIHAVSDRMYGLQCAVVNVASDVKGAQVGYVNHSKKVDGCQIGLVNNTQVLRGVQLGLLNISQDRDGKKKFMPGINIGF